VHGGQPLVVRHALGDETISYSANYLLGWVAVSAGFAMTAMGTQVNRDDLFALATSSHTRKPPSWRSEHHLLSLS